MATQYSRGRKFEYATMGRLREVGFLCVRSAGSHTPVDVVAWRAQTTWLVQCKRDGRLPVAEREKLCEWADEAGGVPVLAATAGRGTVEFIRLVPRGAPDASDEILDVDEGGGQ